MSSRFVFYYLHNVSSSSDVHLRAGQVGFCGSRWKLQVLKMVMKAQSAASNPILTEFVR
jgi:hypothetical protein